MSWDRQLLRKLDRTVSQFGLVKMATIPVYSPLTPFLGLIPGGLRPGLMIRLKGVMRANGHRFTINLQTGCITSPRDDVALHLSVRPNEHCIVRNHMTNQVWGTEERYGGMPLQPGQYFDILILCEAAQFKVAINGVHYCVFQYRVPYHRVQFVHVEGEVTVHSIVAEGDHYQPVPPPQPVPHQPSIHYPQPPTHYPQPPTVHHHHSSYSPFPGAVPVLPVPTPPPPPPPPAYSPYPGAPSAYAPPPLPTMAAAVAQARVLKKEEPE